MFQTGSTEIEVDLRLFSFKLSNVNVNPLYSNDRNGLIKKDRENNAYYL